MQRQKAVDDIVHTSECLSFNTAVLAAIFSTYGAMFGPLLPSPGEAECICAPRAQITA
jgi:hypothetical protein